MLVAEAEFHGSERSQPEWRTSRLIEAHVTARYSCFSSEVLLLLRLCSMCEHRRRLFTTHLDVCRDTFTDLSQ